MSVVPSTRVLAKLDRGRSGGSDLEFAFCQRLDASSVAPAWPGAPVDASAELSQLTLWAMPPAPSGSVSAETSEPSPQPAEVRRCPCHVAACAKTDASTSLT